jgi:hypothetical protein
MKESGWLTTRFEFGMINKITPAPTKELIKKVSNKELANNGSQ